VQKVSGLWPTPCASAHNVSESVSSFERRRANLSKRHRNNGAGTPLPIAVKQEQTEAETAQDQRLSPRWVEILMGFPPGWTET
jgi:hypothetical protein